MSAASKAAFDALVADRRARVVGVRDLRPWDPDLECRLPISPDECNTCERCGAVHPVVWTVAVHGLGEYQVGAGCAAQAMGIPAGSPSVKREVRRANVLARVRAWVADGVRMDHLFHESLVRERAGLPRDPALSVEAYARARAAEVVLAREGEAPWRLAERRDRAVRDLYCARDYVAFDAQCELDRFWARYL